MARSGTIKRALITGITGQDGSYLSEHLISKGYQVFGLVRRTSSEPFSRFPDEVRKKITVLYGNLRDIAAIERAIEASMPDEIYNLAAQSDVGIAFKCPEETFEINYYGVGRLVNAVLKLKPDARVYQASTSEMFGETPPPQNEQSPFRPVSPYGESKLKAHQDFVIGYRKIHNLFIASGILFNHESPRRGEHFVTRKITLSLAKIKLGLQDALELGNLDAERDWGFAGEYTEVMWRMLQLDKPDDFVVATGQLHSVRDFVVATGATIGMPISFEGSGVDEVGRDASGRIVVRVNEKFYRPHEVPALRGDTAKAASVLGWKPSFTFGDLIKLMAEHDLDRQRVAAGS